MPAFNMIKKNYKFSTELNALQQLGLYKSCAETNMAEYFNDLLYKNIFY
ncbi:hypothetical protein DSUL_50453 [Desulfovibrionales bacterium]